MTRYADYLRRFPVLFDQLNRLHRLRTQTPLFRLLRQYLPRSRPFTFLQIGAHDGMNFDPFREFMIQPGARGLAVEPVPEYFERLCRNYRAYPNVTPVHCAIGYPSGQLPFYAFQPAWLNARASGPQLAGMASFDMEKLKACLAPHEKPDDCIQVLNVPVLTVEDVLHQHGLETVDCLFMDCEGREMNVLSSLSFEKTRPRLIVFEHTHFENGGCEINQLLENKGFAITRLSHDSVAVRRAAAAVSP